MEPSSRLRCSIRRVTPPRHVIVCGAGVMGASVAYFLVRRGVGVTVVERSGVACAASGKSGGFLALDWCDGSPLGPLARKSFTLHAELAKQLGTDYGYRRMDTFMMSARDRGAPPGGHRVAAPHWRDGAVGGVMLNGGETLEADAVVLAMGPWTGRAVERLPLPSVYGLKGYSVTLAGADVPAHALFVDYRTADGRAFEPEIFPRPDGEVYVCGMADPAPLPDSPDGVEVSEVSCATLARAAGRVSSALAAARITRRQACYRPVTDDGLPLIGRVPGVAGAYVATGHGPWRILNAPATGLALAELITEGAASLVDLRPFDPARLPAARGG